MSPGLPIKILGISGSLRIGSTNAIILQTIAALAPQEVEFTIYQHLGDLPHFSPERDDEFVAEHVLYLRKLLASSDGVVICTPEYAFGVPGVLKNSLDWMVSSAQYNEKPVAAISASPLPSGGDKAMASLLLTLQARIACTHWWCAEYRGSQSKNNKWHRD
ncbi:MAG: NAD(P)H-dependent oxidoreductase [Ignavibacteria bacterium]|nr:NAD(P)H-dependent oxidoreductase [Ignavibacteria bacterium]